MTKKREGIDPALLDELLAGRDPKTVRSSALLVDRQGDALGSPEVTGEE